MEEKSGPSSTGLAVPNNIGGPPGSGGIPGGASAGLVIQRQALMERNARHVKLKIGEKLYETTVGTLVSHGGIFSAMLEQNEQVSEAYFIDQDLQHFPSILHFLRTSQIDIPTKYGFIEILQLLKEFNYFQIKVDLHPVTLQGHGDGIYQGSKTEKGELDGNGRFWSSSNKEYYEGNFKDSRFSGRGKLTTDSGNTWYEGSWKEGKRDGKGKLFHNGHTTTGTWKNDFLDKLETFLGADGRKLKPKTSGAFSRAPQNECTIEWPNGDLYDGKYESHNVQKNFFMRAGKGVMVYADGSKYEGDWEKDMRHGKGKYTTGDGYFSYDGEWRHDKQHGTATVTYREEWRDGKRVFSDSSLIG